METVISPTFEKFEILPESEVLVPDNSNSDPVKKEPNDVYKGLSQGFTLVFDSKTMLNKPKSVVTTPTTPTTPTRRHQRTFSVVSNKTWTDSPDSSTVIQENGTGPGQHQSSEANLNEETISEIFKNLKEVDKGIIDENKGDIENLNEENNENFVQKIEATEIGSERQEKISKVFVKHNFKSSSNGNLKNGSAKSTERFILHDAPESSLWKTIATFIYFHVTAAVGIFLVLSSQVMWLTIAFTLGLHVLSAFGFSANIVKNFLPQMFNLHFIFDTLNNFIIPTAIPWILWEENIVTSFLVVAQVGYCLHWYGSWSSARDEKRGKHV